MTVNLITISELANIFEINQHTIRHYEEKGLLAPAEVSENGYRKYGLTEAYKLSFVLFLRELGLSLSEINELLESGSKIDYTKVLMERKLKIQEEKHRLDRLSQMVDEQIHLTTKIKEKTYDVKSPIRLKCLVRKQILENLTILDLLESGLKKEIFLGRVYYIIYENFYDVCIEDKDGKDFEIDSGRYGMTVIEVRNEVELNYELEKILLLQELPLIAIEDNERFLSSGERLTIKVLGAQR